MTRRAEWYLCIPCWAEGEWANRTTWVVGTGTVICVEYRLALWEPSPLSLVQQAATVRLDEYLGQNPGVEIHYPPRHLQLES